MMVPFPLSVTLFPIDLRLVDLLGDAIRWRHVLGSIHNQNIKGLNPNYIYHHYNITFENSNKINIKGEIPKNHDYQNMVMESG